MKTTSIWFGGNLFSFWLRFVLEDVIRFDCDVYFLHLDVCNALNPCKNGATCRPNGDGSSCQCTANFQGQFCDKGKKQPFDSVYLNGGIVNVIFPFSSSVNLEIGNWVLQAELSM